MLGYIFVQSGLLFTAMSFACESSVTAATTGSIVMHMNVQEHQDRVLVKARPHTGRAASPSSGSGH